MSNLIWPECNIWDLNLLEFSLLFVFVRTSNELQQMKKKKNIKNKNLFLVHRQSIPKAPPGHRNFSASLRPPVCVFNKYSRRRRKHFSSGLGWWWRALFSRKRLTPNDCPPPSWPEPFRRSGCARDASSERCLPNKSPRTEFTLKLTQFGGCRQHKSLFCLAFTSRWFRANP